MSRPIHTSLYSLMIIGLYFSLSVIYQSCSKSSKDAPTTEDIANKVEEVADSYTEDTFFEDDADESNSSDVDDSDDVFSTSESDNSSGVNDTSTEVSYNNSSSGEAFMVVAGNYLLENNATQMVKKLRTQGYSGAEKVVFDLSQYYTVVAGSYDSRTIAKSISSELNGKGIDNYILKRKR